MDFFEKKICKECKWFNWDDEIPHCIFGIQEIEDIDDFNPMSVHEDNTICSMPRIEVFIKFSPPYNGNDLDCHFENLAWLCPENIRLALRKVMKNTRIEIDYTPRFKKEMEKWRKKINK